MGGSVRQAAGEAAGAGERGREAPAPVGELRRPPTTDRPMDRLPWWIRPLASPPAPFRRPARL